MGHSKQINQKNANLHNCTLSSLVDSRAWLGDSVAFEKSSMGHTEPFTGNETLFPLQYHDGHLHSFLVHFWQIPSLANSWGSNLLLTQTIWINPPVIWPSAHWASSVLLWIRNIFYIMREIASELPVKGRAQGWWLCDSAVGLARMLAGLPLHLLMCLKSWEVTVTE